MADEVVATSDVLESLAAEAAGTTLELKVRDEVFGLAPEIPAIVMLRLSAAGDPKTPPARQMTAIANFLEHAVIPDDRDRFNEFLEDADPIIDFEELNKILERATEVIAARPSEP
jgi:hypothetical protein